MRQVESYDEKPGIAERYSSAIEASHLKVSLLTTGPLDVVIAAGWSGDGMGARLMRLRSEYDTVAAEVRGTANATVTDHLLVLIHLKTLNSVKSALWGLSKKLAATTGFDRTETALRAIVGKCLDVHLDPNCRPCEGRGFNGGGRHEQTGPQVICKRCKGTGKRNGEVGQDDEERRFADKLLTLMEQSAANAEANMAKALHSRPEMV